MEGQTESSVEGVDGVVGVNCEVGFVRDWLRDIFASEAKDKELIGCEMLCGQVVDCSVGKALVL
jgi:hypothetical protein